MRPLDGNCSGMPGRRCIFEAARRLYNQAQRDIVVAGAVIRAAQILGLPLLGQPGSVLEPLGESGVRFIAEGFPDRRYRDDGSLVPRTQAGAVLHTEAEIEAQVLRLAGRPEWRHSAFMATIRVQFAMPNSFAES